MPNEKEWSIQDIARSAGTTSRTLRHYGDIGLLEPSRLGSNGYRYYDQEALIRLQRILLLRELGLGLPAIAEVLEGEQNTAAALRAHLEWLEDERRRLGRQIESVKTTLRKTEGGEQLMADEMFDGFDHTKHEKEVTERWGAEAYRKGDQWWKSLTAEEKKAHQQLQVEIAADFGQAKLDGLAIDSAEVQVIAGRLHDWLRGPVGTVSKEYFAGLGQLYVDDPRYGQYDEKQGPGTAEFMRDAMKVYAERNL
ncbi:DNA-binding transcriptional regulator, MerR family [Amycolatopsis xylanica]|uniref:DNA-binding transcriptional regulator, MerR family n=1 Tax=Amycolatopsis xylanica TaxID=589385 RepID=A0A1H3AGD3_9PSEU|nr:TipAS antibiotic-recognition domain-containing protein [Amycolatopsis xylanica]SDX28224.1 DNA-binding transcriptional regulator, MerR family [Amycolatopsis xylanica]